MNFFEDIRFGFRMLAKEPNFTAVVVIVLALGLGANTTVFTLANAVLFRGLPFENQDRVIDLRNQVQSRGENRLGISYPDFLDYKQAKSFQDLAAYSYETMTVSDQSGVPERYYVARVSANLFSLIGQRVVLGRDFMPGEDKPGAAAVVILGHGIWKTRYGGAPSILGRTIRVNDVPVTVIGIMPDGMKFPLNNDLWTPLIPSGDWMERDRRKMNVFGRLKEKATLASARAELDHIAKTLEQEYPKTNRNIRVIANTYNDAYNGGSLRLVFLALLGAVGFVLMIACANVANLLLSRSLARAKEISIRTALGASRWRIIRQLLIESVMLALLGGVLGLLLSLWGVRMFDLAIAGVRKPYWIKFTMDYAVFGYLAAISLFTGILFGLAPALHMVKVDINEILKEGGRGTAGSSRARFFSSVLVIGELALALVLLVGAGLMMRAFLKVYRLDPGFNTNNILTMQFELAEAKYATAASRVRFYEQALPRLASIPGVESVAFASEVPLNGASDWQFELEGQPVERENLPVAQRLTITPDYFRMLGLQVRKGRMFDNSDGPSGKLAVVVNQQFVAKFFPAADPIGKHLRLAREAGEQPWLTVVGVSPNLRTHADREEVQPVIYVSYRQDPFNGGAILARTKLPATALAGAFRKEVQLLDSDLPLFDIASLEEGIAQSHWGFRVFGSLFAVFALIALVLSAVGIYAVISYAVTQRIQEIGIRMALGASRANILRLILSLGGRQLGIGLAVGLAIAFALTRVLAALLFGISPTDPITFITITLLLGSIGLLACWLPGRRATQVDPLVALRHE